MKSSFPGQIKNGHYPSNQFLFCHQEQLDQTQITKYNESPVDLGDILNGQDILNQTA